LTLNPCAIARAGLEATDIMPTKRMRRARERVPDIPLDEGVILTLLSGWSASMTARSDADDDLFFEGEAGCARLWRAHAPFLRFEARRRRIAPAFPNNDPVDDPCFYFGEFCAFKEATWR
jgi:hypothetical protein